MAEAVHLEHAVAGRARLRAPARRGDSEWFERIRQDLQACEGVVDVEARPLTGCLVVRHVGEFAGIADIAARQAGLRVEGPPAPAPLRPELELRLERARAAVSEIIGREFSWRQALLSTLVGLGLFQLFRGRVLAPAATLLWYALTLALWSAQTDVAKSRNDSEL